MVIIPCGRRRRWRARRPLRPRSSLSAIGPRLQQTTAPPTTTRCRCRTRAAAALWPSRWLLRSTARSKATQRGPPSQLVHVRAACRALRSTAGTRGLALSGNRLACRRSLCSARPVPIASSGKIRTHSRLLIRWRWQNGTLLLRAAHSRRAPLHPLAALWRRRPGRDRSVRRARWHGAPVGVADWERASAAGKSTGCGRR